MQSGSRRVAILGGEGRRRSARPAGRAVGTPATLLPGVRLAAQSSQLLLGSLDARGQLRTLGRELLELATRLGVAFGHGRIVEVVSIPADRLIEIEEIHAHLRETQALHRNGAHPIEALALAGDIALEDGVDLLAKRALVSRPKIERPEQRIDAGEVLAKDVDDVARARIAREALDPRADLVMFRPIKLPIAFELETLDLDRQA